MKIGEQLKQNRLKAKLTQAEVAEEIFVSVRSISNWENGRNLPDIESLIRLAKLYQLSLNELLLEGSDMVEELKKKEQAVKLTQFLLTGSLISGALLWAMMFFMPWNTAGWLKTAITIAFVSNLAPTFYFQAKVRQLKGKPYDWQKELQRSRLVMLVGFLFVSLFIAYLCTL